MSQDYDLLTLENYLAYLDSKGTEKSLDDEASAKNLLEAVDIETLNGTHQGDGLEAEDAEFLREEEIAHRKLLQEVADSTQEISLQVRKKLIGRVKPPATATQGISLLDAKNLIFVEYLINLHLYLLQKCQADTPLDEKLVMALIKQKLLLQKLKPVETKLEYQINKLLKISVDESVLDRAKNDQKREQEGLQFAGEIDKLAFKPRVDQLADDGADSDQGSGSENGNLKQKKAKKQTQIYKAPKLATVLQDDDKEKRKIERIERKKQLYLKRKLKDSLLSGMTGVNDAETNPTEVHFNSMVDSLMDKEDRLREKYESENYTRLPLTKEYNQKMKRRARLLEAKKNEKIDDFEREIKDVNELLRYEKLIDGKREDDKSRAIKTLGLKKKKINKKGHKKFK